MNSFARLPTWIVHPARFVLAVAVLYAVRWYGLVHVEAALVFDGMFGEMARHPDVFDTDFTAADLMESHVYNVGMWAACIAVFRMTRPDERRSIVLWSVAVFAVMGLFFTAVTAVHMNHFESLDRFFHWSMVDAAIVFPLLGVVNGLFWRIVRRAAVPATA